MQVPYQPVRRGHTVIKSKKERSEPKGQEFKLSIKTSRLKYRAPHRSLPHARSSRLKYPNRAGVIACLGIHPSTKKDAFSEVR